MSFLYEENVTRPFCQNGLFAPKCVNLESEKGADKNKCPAVLGD